MAKGKKIVYFCQNCGNEESKWLGQCPSCKEWNTFVEEKVIAILVVPVLGISPFRISNPRSTMLVVIAAARYIPVPQASPMAAVTHRPAAVVRPRTMFFWKMMVPAPRKPMPETTCAATREESFRSMPKPYCETMQNRALPIATRKWVRKPASFERYSLSMPMIPPRSSAIERRSVSSKMLFIIRGVLYV